MSLWGLSINGYQRLPAGFPKPAAPGALFAAWCECGPSKLKVFAETVRLLRNQTTHPTNRSNGNLTLCRRCNTARYATLSLAESLFSKTRCSWWFTQANPSEPIRNTWVPGICSSGIRNKDRRPSSCNGIQWFAGRWLLGLGITTKYPTVEGSEIRLTSWGWYLVYPVIYRVLYIPGGRLGFLNHQQFLNRRKWWDSRLPTFSTNITDMVKYLMKYRVLNFPTGAGFCPKQWCIRDDLEDNGFFLKQCRLLYDRIWKKNAKPPHRQNAPKPLQRPEMFWISFVFFFNDKHSIFNHGTYSIW